MGLILCYCGFQCILVVFGHFALYRLFQGAIYGIGLIALYIMGFISTHCGFQSVLVVFGHFAFYRLFQGAIYGIGLIALYIMGFISTHCGFQSVLVVFGHFASDSGLHFAADSGGQVIVNGVGHIFVSPIHQVLSRMGNHSFFSGILDIRSSLLGVGLVCSVTSEGIESFIAQVGGGFVLSIGIGCGTLDARAFYSQNTLVPLTICIGSFGPSGSAVFIVVDGAFFYAAIFRAFGCLGGGDFTGCHFRAGIYCVVTYNTLLVHFDFIHIQLAGNSQGTANGNAASGCQGTGLDISGFHCAVGLDKTAACIEAVNSCGSCCQVAADFSLASGFQCTRVHCSCSFDGTCTGINPCSDYISICAHCKVISSCGQCTCGELSAYRSIIGNSQGIAFQIPFCFNTTSRFNTSSFQLVCYFHTSCRNFICERTCGAFNGAAGDGTAAGIDITAVGTEYPSLGVDISAAGLDYTAIGLDGTTLGCQVTGLDISSNSIYCEITIAYFQIAVCFYISGNGQKCHFCFGFIYISVCYIGRICFRI